MEYKNYIDNQIDIIHKLAVENLATELIRLLNKFGYDSVRGKNAEFKMTDLKRIVDGDDTIVGYVKQYGFCPSYESKTIDYDKYFIDVVADMKNAISTLREFQIELDKQIKELERFPISVTRKILIEKH